jgi:hypothetical protein
MVSKEGMLVMGKKSSRAGVSALPLRSRKVVADLKSECKGEGLASA